jgi:hypothetical protein
MRAHQSVEQRHQVHPRKGHARWLSPKKRHARYCLLTTAVGLLWPAVIQTAGDATAILLMQSFVRTLVGCPPVAVRVKDDSSGCAAPDRVSR